MVRIALVGTGWQGQGHASTLTQIPSATVVGICDVDMAKAEKAAAKFGLQAFDSYTRMLDEAKPEGVVICTPPEARLELVREAANRGIHCFIEKPPAKDLAAARAVQEVLDNSRILNSVGFMFRYSPAVDKCKELLAGKRVALVRTALMDGIALRPNWPRWFFNKERSGGPIFDQAIHMFDLCRFILGEVATVSGFSGNLTVPKGGDFTVEDSFSLALQYEKGILQTHTHSWSYPDFVCQLEFFSDELHVTLDLKENSVRGTVAGEAVNFEYPGQALYRLELEAFIEAISGKGEAVLRSSYRDSIDSLALALAATAAAEQGQTVPVTK